MSNLLNPIFNSNRMKLGTFGTNGVGPLTTVSENYTAEWANSLQLAQMADRAGLEAIIPYSRWKGYVTGEPDDRTGRVMDAFTWAAGVAASTNYSAIFSTAQAPTFHPIVAAKQCATIDIISNGRFGLNVVGGWNRPELEMFGAPMKEHDERYAYLAEWLEIMTRLWQSDTAFDHHGQFFDIVGGAGAPRPIQTPRLPIMNAGGSPRGMQFAAQHADMCFVIVQGDDPATVRAQVDEYKLLAKRDYNRDVQVWSSAYVVQRDTDEEAQAYLKHYSVDHEDTAAVDAWLKLLSVESKLMAPDALRAARQRFAAGAGGFPLVGTPDRIVSRLQLLSDSGIDGVVLTWVDFVDGLARFIRDCLPLMEEAGLREKFSGASKRAA